MISRAVRQGHANKVDSLILIFNTRNCLPEIAPIEESIDPAATLRPCPVAPPPPCHSNDWDIKLVESVAASYERGSAKMDQMSSTSLNWVIM